MQTEPNVIIRGGKLLNAQAHSANYADILINGDTIVEIGQPGLSIPPGAKTINAHGMLLHPGLVNAHTHSHGNLAKGLGDRWTLELLLASSPWNFGQRVFDDIYLSTKIGAIEMITKGCTACYDLMVEMPAPTADGLEAAGKAYRDVGMRAVIAPMVADKTFYEAIPGLMEALTPSLRKEVEKQRFAPCKASLKNIHEALRSCSLDSEFTRAAIAPTIPLHCSGEFMRGCAKIAHEFDIGVHSHVAESKIQAISGLKLYGKSLTAHLEDIGLLGPKFTVAHGVWLDDDEFRRLSGNGASVAHNPGSNMRLGIGLADARGMLNYRVNLGIGTDGAHCSDNQNMYEAMRITSMVSRVQGTDQSQWLSTEEIFTAATEGSARALGWDNIGRIESGYKADIVFLDLQTINWIPLNDPTNQLVHTEDGSSVRHVMVDGELVVHNRLPVNIDMVSLAKETEAARARLARVNLPGKMLFERLERVVGSFCPGLAMTPHHINRYVAGRH